MGAHLNWSDWAKLLKKELTLVIAQRRGSETLPVTAASGRVLAEPVIAQFSQPAVPVAAMDGFALAAVDSNTTEFSLPVSMDIPAGVGLPAALPAGTAARIMTGAPVPVGADLVVQVERTNVPRFADCPSTVDFTVTEVDLQPGRHIRRVGEEFAAGDVLAAAGQVVSPALIGVALGAGVDEVRVLTPLRLAIVATGDELVDEVAEDGSVRESNSAMLAAAARTDGAHVITARAGDDPRLLQELLESLSAEVDLIVTTGGVGAGAYDVVKLACQSRDQQLASGVVDPMGKGCSRFEHLALRPGGPQGFGILNHTGLIHLPGTPVGALLAYHLFIRQFIVSPPRILQLPLQGEALHLKKAGTFAIAATLTSAGVHLQQGRRVAPFVGADAIALVEGGPGSIEPGSLVSVALL